MNLRELVFRAMDNALENGYEEANLDPEAVAIDLADLDATIEATLVEEHEGNYKLLIPHVRAWQEEHNA